MTHRFGAPSSAVWWWLLAAVVAIGAYTPLIHAQEVAIEAPPAAMPTGPIVSVRIEPPLENEDPWDRLGLVQREAFSPALAREALRRALATGTFADARLSVAAVQGGVEVILRGERRYWLQAVTIGGNRARNLEAVVTDLGLRSGTFVTDAMVTDALGRLVQGYRDLGWESAQATTTWRETDDPGTRVLIIHIEEGTPTRVAAVRLIGIPHEAEAAMRDALGVSVGDIARLHDVRRLGDAATQALHHAGWLSGHVATPRFIASGDHRADLLVAATAGDPVTIEWRGVHAFARQDLVDALRLDEERGLDGGTLTALVSRVQEAYVRIGYLDVRVRGEVLPNGPDRRALRFTITEGRAVHVRNLSFPGAHAFSQASLADDVRGLMTSQLPAGSYAPTQAMDETFDGEFPSITPRSRPHPPETFDPANTYVPEMYAEAGRRIASRYHDAGFLDATVAAPVVTRRAEADGTPMLDVSYTITEGPRSMLEELAFVGNNAIPSASLADAAALELGGPLSYRDVEEARVRLADYYRERAYAFVHVDPEVDRSDDRTRARVRMTVHEGPQVRVGRIRVHGNTTASESMIRERMSLVEGGLYLLSDVRASQRHLGELGVFTGVSVALEDPDVEAPVKNVVVQLSERKLQVLELRAGYSTAEGVRGGFEYGYNDLFGHAVGFTLRARVGYLIQIPGITPTFFSGAQPTASQLLQYRVAPSLVFPYIPRVGSGFSVTVDGTLDQTLTPPWFLIRTVGAALTVTNRSVRTLTFSLTGEIQDADTALFGSSTRTQFLDNFVTNCLMNPQYNVDACNTMLLADRQKLLPDGVNLLGSMRLGITLDRRDSAFTPTRGFYISVTTELLNVLSPPPEGISPTTLHITGRITGYVPLPLGIVFTSSFRSGRNFECEPGEYAHPTRLFFLGGADSMRGWQQNLLYPQDIVDQVQRNPSQVNAILNNFPGGEFFVNWVNEVRIPTGLCAGSNLCVALGLFVDVGNLWKDVSAVDLTRLRWSPGAGLRLTTPFGLVALDLGFNPLERAWVGECPVAFQFSLGSP